MLCLAVGTYDLKRKSLGSFPLAIMCLLLALISFSELLDVKVVDSFDMYLYLPTIVGQSKNEVFALVKERVWKKLKDWKERALSRAGREVLVKYVAQAIPTYVMSYFALPTSLCEEIEFMINRFF